MYQRDRPTYAYEISKGWGLEQNTVLGSLHRLESAGYVAKAPEPPQVPAQDCGQRRVWFELTAEGRDFAATTIEATQTMVANQAQSIGLGLKM